MRTALVLLSFVAPITAFAQYIGHPAGKAIPLGVMRSRFGIGSGYAGFEAGYTDLDLEADYEVTGGFLRETSNLEESYFAVYGGGHTHGFELEARIGGAFQEIREHALTEDPYEDGGGVLVGGGARWGFSPASPFRLGLGGQFTYTYSEGDSYVSDGFTVFREDVELELWRGQLFAGCGVDLQAGREVTISPYLGAGLGFLDGELTIDSWDGPFYYEEKVGDFDERNVGFVFGGIDIHAGRAFRVGVEGRGNGSGWVVAATIGWRF
jgi:opacity protein-like surface antigen